MDQIAIGKRFKNEKDCRRLRPQIFVGETSVEEREARGCWEPRGMDVGRGSGSPTHAWLTETLLSSTDIQTNAVSGRWVQRTD